MGHYFVAIAPHGLGENSELKQLLGKVKRTLSDRELDARWVHPDLWHVTVQFLGALSQVQIDALPAAIANWSPLVSDLILRLQGLGGFPSPEHARVLWIGVQENQQLLNLQTELAIHLRAHGFSVEAKEFQPHLTLAKLRNPHSLTDVIGLGRRKHFGDYAVGELIVFESVLQGNILRYQPRLRKKLAQ